MVALGSTGISARAPRSERRISRMIVDDIEEARAKGDLAAAASSASCCGISSTHLPWPLATAPAGLRHPRRGGEAKGAASGRRAWP